MNIELEVSIESEVRIELEWPLKSVLSASTTRSVRIVGQLVAEDTQACVLAIGRTVGFAICEVIRTDVIVSGTHLTS
ncbi:unnamed protein product [Cochlearia groenlandica]